MFDVVSNVFTFLVVVAISFAILALITSFVRFHLLTQRIQQADPSEVDPEDVFQLRIVQELGALHQSPAPFSVLLLEPAVPPDFEAKNGSEAISEWGDAFVKKLRSMVRANDEVFRFEGNQCGILGRFPVDRAETVARRLSSEIARVSVPLGSGVTVRWPVHIGLVSHPEHGDRAVDLLDQARTALAEARKGGAVRYHILPAPGLAKEGREAAQAAAQRDQQASALLDELTGVLRPERLGTAMQKFIARQRKANRAVSVIYLSVDYFQQYRDHYNPEAADTVLKGVADLLSTRTRETDVLARAAESEFAVVMDCAPVQALSAAQRLSAEIKKVPFRSGSTNLRITVSIGVAGYPDHSGQARELLSFAESAMAAARARGRSVCLIYQPAMQPRQQEAGPRDVF